MKMSEPVLHARVWMSFTIMMTLRERSQTQNCTYCMILFI